MRKQALSAVLLAISFVLAGCGSSGQASDPTPTAKEVYVTENARLATSKLGPPIQLDGCKIQAYEVDVSYPSARMDRYFTLATADCPTANVKSTHENCGKNCEHDVVHVNRKEAGSEVEALVRAEAEAAAEKARLLKKREEILKELIELDKKIEPAK